MPSRGERRRNARQATLQKETRAQRASSSLTSTVAIETINKMVDLYKPYELSASQKYKTYQLMLQHPDVYSAVEARITGIEGAQAKSKLRYDKSSERSKWLKDFIEYNMHTMKGTLRSIGREAAEIVINGLAPFEISTKRELTYTDYIGYRVLDKVSYIDPLTINMAKPFTTKDGGREVVFLNQRRDAFRDTSDLLAVSQINSNGMVEIDMRKVAMVAYGATQSKPFGSSPLDAVYPVWKEIELINEFLLMGVQKDLAGTPVLRIPQEMSDQAAADPNGQAAKDMAELIRLAKNLHAGDQAMILLPSDTWNENGSGAYMYDVSFKGIEGNNKNFDLVSIIEQKRKVIYTVLGAADLITGENGGGSYNLLEGKTNIRAHYSKRDNMLIDEMWNVYIIPLILKMNDLTNEKVSDIPVYRHGEVQPLTFDELSKGLQRMGAVGLLPKYDIKFLNESYEKMGYDYRLDEDLSEEELKNLLSEETSRSGDGMKEGLSNGTGNATGGGDTSITNNENT